MKNNIKGEVVTILLIAIVLGVGGFMFGHKLARTAGNAESTPIGDYQKLQGKQAVVESAASGKVDVEKQKQFDIAQAAVHGTGEAITQAQIKTASGVLPTKELETASKVSDQAITAVDGAVGHPVDSQLLLTYKEIIKDLNGRLITEQARGDKILFEQNGVIQKTSDERKKLENDLSEMKSENVKALGVKQGEVNKWALERDVTAAKWDNLMAKVYIIGGAFVILWLLSTFGPSLAAVFPVFKLPALFASKILAWGQTRVSEKATELNKDLVSLHENSKDFIEENMTPEKLEAFKKQTENWWENDKAAVAKIESIKTSLRL